MAETKFQICDYVRTSKVEKPQVDAEGQVIAHLDGIYFVVNHNENDKYNYFLEWQLELIEPVSARKPQEDLLVMTKPKLEPIFNSPSEIFIKDRAPDTLVKILCSLGKETQIWYANNKYNHEELAIYHENDFIYLEDYVVTYLNKIMGMNIKVLFTHYEEILTSHIRQSNIMVTRKLEFCKKEIMYRTRNCKSRSCK